MSTQGAFFSETQCFSFLLKVLDGAVLSILLKKACIILPNQVRLPTKYLASSTSVQCPYSVVTSY